MVSLIKRAGGQQSATVRASRLVATTKDNMKNKETNTETLRRLIAKGSIQVEILTGTPSYNCPKCKSGNAMLHCRKSPIAWTFHMSDFRAIGLEGYECRDCGYGTIAPAVDPTSPWESTHEIIVDDVPTGITTKGSDAYTIEEQHEIVAKNLEKEIAEAVSKSDNVETRLIS